MSQAVEEVLEHYGAKGMKWGVRRAQKKAAKADVKWQKNIYSLKGAIDVHNNVAEKMNSGGLDKLNSQPKYAKLDAINKPHAPLSAQYYREYEKLTETFTRQAVTEVHGTSPSGNLVAKLDTSDPNQWKVTVSPVDLTHAEIVTGKLVMELNHDDNGHITSTKSIKESISQASTFTDDFMEHYGKKGMKWGVKGAKGGTERTSFGKSPKRLTSAELEKRIKRMETEKKYNQLNKRDVSLGQKKATEILTNVGTSVVQTVVKGGALLLVRHHLEKKYGTETARFITSGGKPKK